MPLTEQFKTIPHSLVLVNESNIKERWRYYVDKLLDTSNINVGYLTSSIEHRNIKYTRKIQVFEVKKDVKKIKIGKVVRTNGIPIGSTSV